MLKNVDSVAASSDDSSDDNGGSEDSDDGDGGKLIKPPLPVLPVVAQSESSSSGVDKARLTRLFSGRQSRAGLWGNDYFVIPEPSPGQGLRIRMRKAAPTDVGGMGTDQQSKHFTPSHYGETTESCAVTILLLRAWMLWRAH